MTGIKLIYNLNINKFKNIKDKIKKVFFPKLFFSQISLDKNYKKFLKNSKL